MKFQDYYETLGVSRDASQEEIRKAFRRLARRYHPDTSKEKDAAKRFKEINEAHEVLGDPEKRKRYDMLGANYRAGQEFTPPPGWENVRFEFHGPGEETGFSGFGGFSDFFETLFGGRGAGGASPFGGFGGFGGPHARAGRRAQRPAQRGQDVETELTITLEEAHHGTKKGLELRRADAARSRRYEVRIPAGTRDGDRLRLSGQGVEGPGGSGDLYIRVRVAPHSVFKVEGHDLHEEVAVTPWEAALGAKIPVKTLDGAATLTLPAGTPSGRALRLRGQGLAKMGGERGDLLVTIRIEVPRDLTPRERELFEELKKVSRFDPRSS
jgi:curved DNA-binding protein